MFSIVLLCSGFAAATPPAHAITADDVLNRMDGGQRSGFISGAVDMASHLFAVAGDREKASCAVKWLFDNDDGLLEVIAFFELHPERDAVALIDILINRQCGG